MSARLAIVALAVSLAGCAGIEPAGRNARNGPTASAPAPAPARAQPPAPLPPPQTATATAPPLVVPQPQPTAPAATPPAAPPVIQRAQPPTPAPSAPPIAAPQVSVPTPPPPQPAPAPSSDDDIVVPGQVRTQVPPPAGDPRTNEERRADVRAWDQCVTQVQSAFDADPMRPQLTTPEEYCAQSLGMGDRTSVPISRRQRR